MVSMTAAWRTGRRERTDRRPRRSVVVGLAVWAGKRLPTWRRVRTATLTVGGFGAIDYGLWSWHAIVGYIAVGVSLLALEALSGDAR